MARLPPVDSVAFDPAAPETSAGPSRSDERFSRWMGGRLRLLVVGALVGCVALFLLVRWLGEQPHLGATWRATPQDQIELTGAEDAALLPYLGRRLHAVESAGDRIVLPDALVLQRSPRWIVEDDDRVLHAELSRRIGAAFASAGVRLHFDDGSAIDLRPRPRGAAGLGSLFWLLSALALSLYLVALVVALARPDPPRLLFALVALAQTGNLVLMAIESTLSLAVPSALVGWDFPLRVGFDLLIAGAVVNTAVLYPRRLPAAGGLALAAWTLAVATWLLVVNRAVPQGWACTQACVTLLSLGAIALSAWSYRIEPHPFAMVLRRFGSVTTATWVLLSAAVALSSGLPAQPSIAAVGSTIWYVFLASLLLLLPFLSKSQQVVREFALLAMISTAATALDLIFVVVFALGQFASLTLALFLAIGIYAGARQWLLNRLLGGSVMTTERMFEHLYRTAREVESRPERTPALLAELVRDLFDPIETQLVDESPGRTRVLQDGAAMLVPIPRLGEPRDADAPQKAGVLIRFAHRGRRLFSVDDARLADRLVEQLSRAVAYDRAVEQGRHEERSRIAQDLHDDIGARLLTLMYQAPTPQMEDYVRNTLKDLKTLTRGLAAQSHSLAEACAEWKADLSQRLTAAGIALDWHAVWDEDRVLNVVQWSGLTRVLRELASNVISHAKASHVSIDLQLQAGRLVLRVCDDGIGRDPETWAHGLGLGGVRKRLKQLGGTIEWSANQPSGICCRAVIADLGAMPGDTA